MVDHLLNQLFANSWSLLTYPIAILCVVIGLACLLRLLKALIFKSKTEYDDFEILFLAGIVVLCITEIQTPTFHFPKGWIAFMYGSFLFSCFCVLVRDKVVSGLSWREFWRRGLEETKKITVEIIDGVRRLFSAIHARHSKLPEGELGCILFLPAFLLAVTGLVMATAYPKSIYGILLVWWTISFSVGLYQCVFKAKSFIKFWLIHALAVMLFLISILENMLPSDAGNIPAVYWATCVAYFFCWCSGAVIAEHDAVKMAGRIINSFAVILLAAANTFLRSYPDMLCTVNFSLIPLAIVGFLAALLADKADRWRVQCKSRKPTEAILKDDQTEQNEI